MIHRGMLSIEYIVWWMRSLLAKSTYGIEGVADLMHIAPRTQVAHLLRWNGAQVGRPSDLETGIRLHSVVNDFSNLRVGCYCHIGKEVFLDLAAPLYIEDRVTISMRVMILTHVDVGKSMSSSLYPRKEEYVHIQQDAYIGAGAIILPGVTIGVGSIVAAGAVVKKDVPPKSLVAGVPARVLKAIENPL